MATLPSMKDVLLTPLDLSTALQWKARAPVPETKPPSGGTRVQMRSYDIVENKSGVKLPSIVERILPDHAYVEYDDGRDRIIARGGPSKGDGFFRDALGGRLRVVGEVTPAARSVDNGQGTKLISETFIPGKTARDAARPAERIAAGVNRGRNLYGARTNSNSFAGDAHEASTGRRPSGPQQWGHNTRLGDGELPPDLQRSRKLLGPGLGSTGVGLAITRVAEDMGERLGGRSLYGY